MPPHLDHPDLAHYQIKHALGKGGMGEVYLAHDTRLKRDVAIKWLHEPDVVVDLESDSEELIHEARALCQLDHPGIGKVIDYRPGPGCLIMAYVPGLTLSETMQLDPLGQAETQRIAEDLLDAVAHMHARGVRHGDIKPSNIIIREGRPVLVDFGLAQIRSMDQTTLKNEECANPAYGGTLAYSAPELFLGEPGDQRSDLFALGCVLYELFANCHPFKAEHQAAIIQNILHQRIDSWRMVKDAIPDHWQDCLLGLLDKNPDRRKLLAAGQTTEEAPVAREGDLAEWMDRGGRKLLRVCLYLAMLVAALLLGKMQPGGDQAESSPGPTSLSDTGQQLISSNILRVAVQGSESDQQGESPLEGLAISTVMNGLLSMPDIDLSMMADRSDSAAGQFPRYDEILSVRVRDDRSPNMIQLERVRSRDGVIVNDRLVPVLDGVEDGVRWQSRQRQMILSGLYSLFEQSQPDQNEGGWPFATDKEGRFLVIHKALQRGDGDRALMLEELKELAEQGLSPAMDLLLIDLTHDVYTDSGDESLLSSAERALDRVRASGILDDSAALIYREGVLALDRNRPARARQVAEQLHDQHPRSFESHALNSRVAERQGELGTAVIEAQRAADLRPSWGALLRVAKLATQAGDWDAGRRAAETILETLPDNTRARSQLGLIELLGGDLDRAERIYRDLLTLRRHRSYRVNLGLVQLLRGDYIQAESEFRAALELSPGHRVVRLNLADALSAQGRQDAAQNLYTELLADYDPNADYTASRSMLYAQCLARLGRYTDAIGRVQKVTAATRQDAEVAWQAALIYTLANEAYSAANYQEQALALGMDQRWFAIPPFAQE